MIRVFTRTWWRYDERRKIVPGVGRKRTIARVKTEDEARTICKEWNRTHKPGPLSRKAEFTDE